MKKLPKDPNKPASNKLQYELTKKGLVVTLPLNTRQQRCLRWTMLASNRNDLFSFFDIYIQEDETWEEAWRAILDATCRQPRARLASDLMDMLLDDYISWPSKEGAAVRSRPSFCKLASGLIPTGTTNELRARQLMREIARAAWFLQTRRANLLVRLLLRATGWKRRFSALPR